MTREQAKVEHWRQRLQALREDLALCVPSREDHEPETPERIALCAARRQEQLKRARAKEGLVDA